MADHRERPKPRHDRGLSSRPDETAGLDDRTPSCELADLCAKRDLERYGNQLRRAKRAETDHRAFRGLDSRLVRVPRPVEGHLATDPSARLRGGRRGRSLPKPLGEDEVATLHRLHSRAHAD